MSILSRVIQPTLLLLFLTACSPSEILQKFASPEEQAVAKGYIDSLRQHRFDEIVKAADPSIASDSFRDTLAKMAAMFPSGNPTSVKLIGAQRNDNLTDSSSIVNLTFEYDFSGKWVVTNVAVKKQGDRSTIVGFHVYPQPEPLEQQNRFTLTGKHPIQYVVLSLAILLPLLTLYALVVCIRTKIKHRKLLWVFFVIFGVGRFAVNWTTGQLSISLLNIQLFSASAFAPLYGPWTIAISLPLGAMIFLLRKRELDVASRGS